MLQLEVLRKRLDKFDDHAHLLSAVKLLLRMQAVVACSAVLDMVCLAEIVEKKLSSA